MSLDGLRAWIGEVERKLGMRTRVFLALAVIAIGGAGAAIYLAIDTRDNAVSENDVQALQRDLEAQKGAGGAGGAATVIQLEAEVDTLKAEVEGLKGKGGEGATGGSGKGATGGAGAGGSGAGSNDEAGGDASGRGTSGAAPGASGGSRGFDALLQKAKEASEKAEGK
jgi:hypothetical protein